MKYIEIDEELYRHIASKTERIGESASEILRRLLGLSLDNTSVAVQSLAPKTISQPSKEISEPLKAVSQPLMPQAQRLSIDHFAKHIDKRALAEQKGAVGRFLFLLETLYHLSPEQFGQVLQVQGRGRLYFATSKEALLESSKTANPKEIGQSGYWVTSNNNTAKKRTILSEVLEQFNIDESEVSEIIDSI
ncbi:replication initiation negative regulator SeqA [Shewanella surugensis]|uniref:Negative modulator of initiation of replication n=1 Tax=Shewanella surugensis TaxID=212020 RepID=A0ABT0LF95_9GAMM|nr:replication initiation negative regulator SeqA [Shewanella surugensis]MCL1126343.1 replication initiation negative regulator SeqA [Shewanella surugensis]